MLKFGQQCWGKCGANRETCIKDGQTIVAKVIESTVFHWLGYYVRSGTECEEEAEETKWQKECCFEVWQILHYY